MFFPCPVKSCVIHFFAFTWHHVVLVPSALYWFEAYDTHSFVHISKLTHVFMRQAQVSFSKNVIRTSLAFAFFLPSQNVFHSCFCIHMTLGMGCSVCWRNPKFISYLYVSECLLLVNTKRTSQTKIKPPRMTIILSNKYSHESLQLNIVQRHATDGLFYLIIHYHLTKRMDGTLSDDMITADTCFQEHPCSIQAVLIYKTRKGIDRKSVV